MKWNLAKDVFFVFQLEFEKNKKLKLMETPKK